MIQYFLKNSNLVINLFSSPSSYQGILTDLFIKIIMFIEGWAEKNNLRHVFITYMM